jgi:sensor histidine kinase YesM
LPDTDLELDNTLVPSMIIQPYIENAIIHGLAPKDGGGKVTIYLKKASKYIICVIEDNGIGIQKSVELQSRRILKGKSKGMGITKARLEILNQELKIPVSVNVKSLFNNVNDPTGTQVEIYIPVHERF